MPGSFVLALAFLVASAASAALPIAPAGAATQAGAGAAILVLGGVRHGGRGRVLGRRAGARDRDGRGRDAPHRLLASSRFGSELAQRARRGRSRLAGGGFDRRAARDEVLLPHEDEGEDRAGEEDEGRDEEDRRSGR